MYIYDDDTTGSAVSGAASTQDCLLSMPLAMAYVRWQPWEEPYGTDKALDRGTIFAGLDLPFTAYKGAER